MLSYTRLHCAVFAVASLSQRQTSVAGTSVLWLRSLPDDPSTLSLFLSFSLCLSLYTDLVGVGKGRMLAPCQLRLRGRGRQHGSFDVGTLRAPVRAADERVADALRRQVQVVEVRAHPRPSCVIQGQQYIPHPTSSTAILMHHESIVTSVSRNVSRLPAGLQNERLLQRLWERRQVARSQCGATLCRCGRRLPLVVGSNCRDW